MVRKQVKPKSKKLPAFKSAEEFAAFVDSHDMGPYLKEMKPAAMTIDRKKIRRQRLTVHLRAADAQKLGSLARKLGKRKESLVANWVHEKLAGGSV